MQAHELEGGTPFELREGAAELLTRSPELRPLLDQACVQLRRVFGPVCLVLERFDDPESPIEKPVLFLVVRASLDTERASALLNRFDEEWWLDASSRASGKLKVDLDFD